MALDPEFEVDLAPAQRLNSASRGNQEPIAKQDRVERPFTSRLAGEFRHRFGVPAVRLVHRADVRIGHGDVKLHHPALTKTAAASYGSSVARIGVSTAPDYHSAENLADSRSGRP
jgi:hypothetical protein